MSRAIVNVASDSWVRQQARLIHDFPESFVTWSDQLPPGCPPHRARGKLGSPSERCVPYAFKAYAMREAANRGFTELLWCDASICAGARPLADLWEYIEREGVWLARNGWTNYEWTADSAYPDLFPECFMKGCSECWEEARAANREIPHVVGTAFGISLKHPKGRAFLDEYYRLASETKAFCGPWQNSNAPNVRGRNSDRPAGPCGPPDVLGHRHDQTAASVIAWRLGVPLTECPEWFAYKGGETEKTCLIADGAY